MVSTCAQLAYANCGRMYEITSPEGFVYPGCDDNSEEISRSPFKSFMQHFNAMQLLNPLSVDPVVQHVASHVKTSKLLLLNK